MRDPQILIQQMSYILPNGKTVFTDLSLAFSKQKTGLIGKNGIGKSTLIKLINGELRPNTGIIDVAGTVAYVPQSPQFSAEETVADFLGCAAKLIALQRIENGSVEEQDYATLNEDWTVAERLQQQLASFGLAYIPWWRPLSQLSGGEMTRLWLAQVFAADVDFLLLDEPTNHLDASARKLLYHAITQWTGGLIVISHDRVLLNLMETIVELHTLGATNYGGNYEAYVEQKAIEQAARELELHDAKKLMQKSLHTVQTSREKHEQKQSYGRKLRKSGSIDKMGANSKQGRSERSQSMLRIKEQRLVQQAQTTLKTAKEKIEITDEIRINIPASSVPKGKIILEIADLCFDYSNTNKGAGRTKLIYNFNLILQGPERIALTGDNGSGKTTLVNLILGHLQPTSGKIHIGTPYVRYLDQSASLLDPELSILENFLQINPEMKEQDAYHHLAAFLFKNISAQKLVKNLSGGEKLRALLACVLMSEHPPQLLILDEPTNHLDLTSIASIESALKNYQGAMIVISHDQTFLENIGVERVVKVNGTKIRKNRD